MMEETGQSTENERDREDSGVKQLTVSFSIYSAFQLWKVSVLLQKEVIFLRRTRE